jgi:pSer/pThr/pTyr-binding forkhead associated (FHA) protein
MALRLIVVKGKARPDEVELRSPVTIIGRQRSCDLVIPAATVSRLHCELALEGNWVRIRDLGSSNGTFVNGQRVKEARATTGDRLSVGPVTFEIYIAGAPGRQGRVEDGFVVSDSSVPEDEESMEFELREAEGKPKEKAAADFIAPGDEDEPLPIFFELDEEDAADESDKSAEQ